MLKCLLIGGDDETCKTIELVVKKIDSIEFVGRYSGADQAFKIISGDHIGILFVDLELLSKSEMTQLRQRKNDELNIIAFDQSGESAADAFEINATDFMLKPATASRTLKAIRKITTKKDSQEKGRNTGNNSLFVKEKGRLVRIFLNDIYLVEALADYVNIYTLSKKYTVHSTMKNIESELQKSNFIRVHKSYIARIDRISEIRKDSLIIEKQTVPIGQSYRKTLIDQLKIV